MLSKNLLLTVLGTLILSACSENSSFNKLDSQIRSASAEGDSLVPPPRDIELDKDGEVLPPEGDPTDPKDPNFEKDPIGPKDPIKPKDPIEPKDPVRPKDPIEPKDPVDPKDPPPVLKDPVTLGGEEKACRYTFRATNIGSNVKVTVISGPLAKLTNLENEELSKLPVEDQAFLADAIQNKLQGISVASGKMATQQKMSEKLIISGKDSSAVSFNQIGSGISLNYLVKGKDASLSATTLNKGSKVYAVLDGKDKASVQFTSIDNDSEVVVLFVTSGDNVTCVSATGVDGRLSSYIYGEEKFVTQGQMKGTGFDEGGSIKHHVFGGDNTYSILKATSIQETAISLKTIGGNNTKSKVQFTGLDINNVFNIELKGTDSAELDFAGTYAGQNTVVNLDVDAAKAASATFKFTAENNLMLNGKISAAAPALNLLGRLATSKSATNNLVLEKK